MLTSPLVPVVLMTVALAAAVLVARAVRRRRGRVLTAVTGVLAFLLVGGLASQAWARAAIDRSAAARAMVWFEADVDDIARFPARTVEAGSTPLVLREGTLPAGTLDTVTVQGGDERLRDLVDRTQTEALLVLRDDEVVHEQYAHGGAADELHTSFSVAKSVLSTLLGIAVDRGEVGSLDDPVTTYVPELAERDPRFADITLRHLASMASGLCYSEHGTPWSDDSVTYYAPDLREVALSAEVCEPPGRRWHYDNYNPLLVGLVLERATGVPVAEYTSRHLWGPMGAEADGSWSLDSTWSGFEKMESGVNAVPRDFARFGYLFAHDGVVDGRQVVPAAWVREATARDTSADPAEHYGLWWWVDTEREGRFTARGNHGQFVYVDPATDVVVVRLGRTSDGAAWPALLRDITDRVNAAASP